MAPSSGTLLIPQAFKIFKHAVSKTTSALRSSAPSQSTATSLRHVARATHRLSHLRPSRNAARKPAQSLATTLRNTIFRIHFSLNPTPSHLPPLRSSLPKSHISRHLVSRPGFAPFASTLRPNLTGGALPRSAGGYALSGGNGGVRAFSHVPAQQAQVLQSVSLGVRAFWDQGNRARFEGWSARNEKVYGRVSQMRDEVARQVERNSPFVAGEARGSSLEFQLGPTVTAMKGTNMTERRNLKGLKSEEAEKVSLHTPQLLETLTSDFSAAIATLSAVLADLNTLSARIGDLPISYSTSDGGKQTLSVRFPGCDAQAVEALCAEIGIRRGVVREDDAWDTDKDVQMALLFPFAADGPGEDGEMSVQELFEKKRGCEGNVGKREEVFWADMLSPEESPAHEVTLSPLSHAEIGGSPFERLSRTSADGSFVFEAVNEERDVWAEECVARSESEGEFEPGREGSRTPSVEGGGYDGIEGICRFLVECEAGRRA